MRLLVLFAFSVCVFAQGPPGGGGGQGDGIWRRNAAFGESITFDGCLAHQPPSGEYHNHVQPICLRAQLGDNVTLIKNSRVGASYQEKASGWKHSPILGWALDGYPIYGPYGYSDPASATSAVKRMTSGFRLRAITVRTSLPDWALGNHAGVSQALSASQYGPPVNATYPAGRYVEDYEYVAGLGDLDQYNGRTTVTPDFPKGTYAYFATLDASGAPAFPYILAGQYYGTASGGNTQTVTGTVQDYFNNHVYSQTSSTTPQLAAWTTANSSQFAQVVSGFDPAAGAVTTWPGNEPSGAHTTGNVTAPTYADIQRIRYSASSVYVNANGLPSYTFGPWFGLTSNGGVFANFPSAQANQFQFPLAPAAAATHGTTGLGAAGLWVNGVAVFNFLDGATYSNSQAADVGGGAVAAGIVQVSAASFEGGPVAPGSLVASFPIFGAVMATSTEAAASAAWPLTLGGTVMTVTDSANVTRTAELLYASATQVNFRVPDQSAVGIASVKITAGGSTATGSINVVAVYPNLFAPYFNLAVGGQNYLIVAGSGLGAATSATATVGGVNATVAYAGPQGTYKGLDQYNILVPAGLSGKGPFDVVVTAGGRPSNAIGVTLP